MYALLVAAAGATANLLIAAMFVARVVAPRLARPVGFAGVAMAVPLAVASWEASRTGLGPWAIALPLVFLAFAAIEVVVDMLLPGDVRASRWLWAYLASFYLAQWAVVGAAFIGSRAGGFAVLATYFVCLAATAWSFRHVGHGQHRTSSA